MSEELFRPNFALDKNREAVSGRAWLGAMLEAAGTLAHVEAQAGLIPRRLSPLAATRGFSTLRNSDVEGRSGHLRPTTRQGAQTKYCF